MNKKKELHVVNCNPEASELQKKFYDFIKKFLLCRKCKNPQISFRINKKAGHVSAKCNVCENTNNFKYVHNVTKHILKILPQLIDDKAAFKVEERENHSDMKSNEETIIDQTTTQESIDEAENKLKELSTDENKTDNNKEILDKVSQLYKEGKLLSESKTIQRTVKQLKLKESCIISFMEIIFESVRTVLHDIEKYKSFFHLFTRSRMFKNERFQKYVLGGMMKLVEKFKMASKSIYLLYALYEHDIIEEDAILEWFDKGPSKKYVRKDLSKEILESCIPMIEWLRTVEYESEEDNIKDLKAEVNESQSIGHKYKLIENGDDEINIDEL